MKQNLNTVVDEKFDFLVNGISQKNQFSTNVKDIIKQTGINIVNSSFGEQHKDNKIDSLDKSSNTNTPMQIVPVNLNYEGKQNEFNPLTVIKPYPIRNKLSSKNLMKPKTTKETNFSISPSKDSVDDPKSIW